MGCATSKSAANDAVDPDQVQLQSGGGNDANMLNNKTKSGFQSDIQTATNTTIGEHIVHENVHKLTEVYDVDEAAVLGRGACGTVCVVNHKKSNQGYAMKTVAIDAMSGTTMEELHKEIELQRKLDHPGIVKIYESFDEPSTSQIHIIMELCSGGSLVSRMKTHRHGYGEKAAATLIEKMLSAVMYCHHNGLVHRDIKLDNFIYENSAEDAEIKLIDFGFAEEVGPGNEAMWDQIGTPSYMAPELWSDSLKEYDSSVDMWAMGVVTFMLLSGKRPFHHQDRKEKARMIRNDALKFSGSEWERVSDAAKDFCWQLMQKEPRKRLAASQALEHQWIKQASTLHSGKDAAEELAAHTCVVDSLQAFARADDVKKAALEVIAFSTPPQKVEELRELFVKMDVDNSGTIDAQEFRKAMAHSKMTDEKVDKLFKEIDYNGSGALDYTEFLGAALASQKGMQKPSLLQAFSMLDRDGNGQISPSELRSLLGNRIDDQEIARVIKDIAGDAGFLTFQDFKTLMLRDVAGTRGFTSASNLNTFVENKK